MTIEIEDTQIEVHGSGFRNSIQLDTTGSQCASTEAKVKTVIGETSCRNKNKAHEKRDSTDRNERLLEKHV